MKRIVLLIAALTLLLTMTACGGNSTPTEAASESTADGTATEAPYIGAQISEPEWTLAEGELQLEDQNNIYAESQDIMYFAIVTSDDGSQELRFRLNDETANMLTSQSPDNNYYITLNSENIGSATLNDDCTVVTITAENANGEITALASKIRGLTE